MTYESEDLKDMTEEAVSLSEDITEDVDEE